MTGMFSTVSDIAKFARCHPRQSVEIAKKIKHKYCDGLGSGVSTLYHSTKNIFIRCVKFQDKNHTRVIELKVIHEPTLKTSNCSHSPPAAAAAVNFSIPRREHALVLSGHPRKMTPQYHKVKELPIFRS